MLPSLPLLKQIQQKIKTIPNQQGEYKRNAHYGLFLLCYGAGLRVSEAVNFDLSAKTQQGLYRLNKTKGKQERFAYIPKQVINELKKYNWQPNRTNRFNFYHFLRRIKREINLPANAELTPHTLRRSFTTYHAENGLSLPILSKMLGHKSVRTTALYWMNTYHPDDDDNNTGAILCGKNWLEGNNPKVKIKNINPEAPTISEIPHYWNQAEQLTNNLRAEQEINQKLRQQLNEKDEKVAQLTTEKETLQDDLSNLSEQNNTLRQELTHTTTEKAQVQHDLAAAKEIIKQLEQELTNERQKRTIAENNLLSERKNNQFLRETNTNLTQKIHFYEQNLTDLTTAHQNAIKDKETTKKQLNNLITTIKTAAKQFKQWQKLNYYQQLEKQNELKAQMVQPPPWKFQY